MSYTLQIEVCGSIEMQITFLKLNLLVQLVSIIDVLFAFIVVAPLVVTFWSTTWMLYDLCIVPNDPVISGAVSWSFGFVGQMVLMFYQDSVKKLLTFKNHNFLNVLVVKIYALFLAHTFVSFWRGVWMFVDATSSTDVGVVGWNIFQNIITLMTVKAFRNALVPPFMMVTDDVQDQFSMRTLLQKDKVDGRFMFFVDCLSTMFVEMLIAFVWHDCWIIHDLIILPDDPFYSALASLVFGYLSALLCFTVESYVGILCEKYDNQKLFIFEAFTIVTLLSAINVWRGLWSFVAFFIDGNNEWILILNTLAWISLMIINCSLSLSAKDVYKDAEEPGRYCTKYQTQYFSAMLSKKTDKTTDKTCNLATISTQL